VPRWSVRDAAYDFTMADTNSTTPNPEKDPADWVTGEEPATGPQLSYLGTLAQEAGAEVPAELTKAEASRLIDELQDRTGRGSSKAA
jgi:hypothetical protein